MTGQNEELRERLREFRRDATKVVDRAEEALEHLEKGNLKAVAEVVGISQYTINQVSDERMGILQALERMGITLE